MRCQVVLNQMLLTYDKNQTLPNCAFTRDGYVFDGWIGTDLEETTKTLKISQKYQFKQITILKTFLIYMMNFNIEYTSYWCYIIPMEPRVYWVG